MRKIGGKSLLALAVVLLIALLTNSCSQWMADNGFMDQIEDEVLVANAEKVNVYIRYANTKMGTTNPTGDTTMKVGVPSTISSTTNTEYGFYKWAAFTKGSGKGQFDISKQNSELYYKNEDYYNENYKKYELGSDSVSFDNASSEATRVTVKRNRNDIVIVPVVVERPYLSASVPINGKSNVVRNQTIRILMSKAISPNGLQDNIRITSGPAVFTEDTDDSDAPDITERFDISLSRTGRMITCKLKDTYNGKINQFDSNSQITVTLYTGITDTLGYPMEENQKMVFQTGTSVDSLAPKFLESPKAGIGADASSYGFLDIPKSEAAKTAGASYDASLYYRNRVKDKFNIWVQLGDLAGAGANLNDTTSVESDVAFVKVGTSRLKDNKGTLVSAVAVRNNEIGYIAGGSDTSYKGGKTIKDAAALSDDKGTLFTYNLDTVVTENDVAYVYPDGLIRVDICGVDMVGNEGYSEPYWKTYDNGYRSLFLVKDETPPVVNKEKITSSGNQVAGYTAVTNSWYNASTIAGMKIKANDGTAVVDAGDPDYASYKKDLQWMIKINPEEDWNPETELESTAWKPVYTTSDNKNNVSTCEEYSFTNTTVSSEGLIDIKVTAKDDLGNASVPVSLGAVYYDSVSPKVESLEWIATTGTAGITTGKVLSDQKLQINLTDETAGVEKLSVKVTKDGAVTTYQTPFKDSAFKVYYNNQSLTKDADYTVSGDTITFNVQNAENKSYITTGVITLENLTITDESVAANREGKYSVKVEVVDAAQNKDAASEKAIEINNDSTAPVVQKIEIPGLKMSHELNTSSVASQGTDDGKTVDTFWLDSEYFGGTNRAKNEAALKGKVYITINEDGSGVSIINIGGTAQFQSVSKLYTVADDGTETEVDISKYAFGNSYKTITIKNSADALKNAEGKTNFVIMIDNVKFTKRGGCDSDSAHNTVEVTVTDVALNASDTVSRIYKKDTSQYADYFWTDSWQCAMDELYLHDSDTFTNSNIKATADYTNSESITVSARMCAEGKNTSGHNKFVLTNAKFTSQTEVTYALSGSSSSDAYDNLNKQTTGYYGGVIAKDHYTISEDGRTLELRNADSSVYYIFKNEVAVRFTNVLLDDPADGTKSVSLQVYDLAGWNNISGAKKNKSITLDKEKPEIRRTGDAKGNGHGLFTFSGSGNSSYRVSSIADPSKFVYPHGGTTEGIVLDTNEKNGDGKQIYYFYVSAQSTINTSLSGYSDDNPIYGTTANPSGNVYGVALGIGVSDNIKIKNSSSNYYVGYYIYKHGTGDDNSILTAEKILAKDSDVHGTLISPEEIGRDIANNWSKTGREMESEPKEDPYNRQWFPLYGDDKQTYSVILADEAGNYSKADTFVVVKDVSRPSTKVTSGGPSLSTAFTIAVPAEAKVFRNNNASVQNIQTIGSRNYDDLYDRSVHGATTYYSTNYVIKKTDDRFKIKIYINGFKKEDIENTDSYLDGNSITADSNAYSEIAPTQTDSGLEAYSISHWYANWRDKESDTASYLPSFPDTTITPTGEAVKTYFNYTLQADDGGLTEKAGWHTYQNNSSAYYDDDLKSYVDASGNIIIELRNNKSTPPLTLLLKDHCGNLNYILIRPTSMEGNGKETISFTVDNKIGEGLATGRNIGMNTYMAETAVAGYGKAPLAIKLDGEPLKEADNTTDKMFYWGHRTSSYQPGSETLTSGITGIGVIAPDVNSGITYYNDNAYLGLYNKAESCTFASAYRHGTAPSDGQYTLRARVRAWDATGDAPTRNDFINGTGSDLSSWVYLRDESSSGNNDYVLQYPHPTRTEKFRLYYYVEDAVGNYEINTVVNDSADEMVYWRYDNAGPSVLTRKNGRDPSTITGADINELVATNNGFNPYYKATDASTGVGYVVRTETLRSGQSLPAKENLGNGIVLGCVNGGENRKYGNYFDLDITETSGIRAFIYTKTATAPDYSTCISTMGDGSAWYAGVTTYNGTTAMIQDRNIGSSLPYPYKKGKNNVPVYSNEGNVNYDYYDSNYGSTKYSGVKVVATIPNDLVVTNATTPLYLHVMDWVGNITTVQLGNGISWKADLGIPETRSVDTTYNNDNFIDTGNTNGQSWTRYTFAATKPSISSATADSFKIYLPNNRAGDNASGLYGWSRTDYDKSSVLRDPAKNNQSYILLTGDELQQIKDGGAEQSFTLYLYDNVGWTSSTILKVVGDNVLPNMTPYIRGVEGAAFALSFIKESMSSSYGLSNNNNPVGNECVSSTLYNTEAEIAAHARTVYTIGETAVFLFNSPSSDNHNATVSHWNGSEWVLDADLLTEKHGEGATNWWVENGWYSSKKIKDFISDSYYRYTVIDKAGNENYAYIKLIKDIAPPTVSAGSVTKVNQINGVNYYNANSKATVEYSDTGSGIASYTNASGTTATTPSDTYTSTIDGFEVNIGSMTPSSGKLQFTATDNLGNGGTVNLSYAIGGGSAVDTWVKDTDAPTYTSVANQNVVKPGHKTANDIASSANIKMDNAVYNNQASIYCATSEGITNIDVNDKVNKFTFTLPTVSDINFLGWKVQESAMSNTDWYDVTTGGTFITSSYSFYRKLSGSTGDAEIPTVNGTEDKYVYFYPIDKAGNIGTPVILKFVKAPLPVILSISPSGIINNHYDGNSTVSIQAKYSWAKPVTDMIIKQIGISDGTNYVLYNLPSEVTLTYVGATATISNVPLSGVQGTDLEFEIITDKTSSVIDDNSKLSGLVYDTSVSDVTGFTFESPASGNGVYFDPATNKLYYSAASITIVPVTADTDIDYFYYNNDSNKSTNGKFVMTPAAGTYQFYAKDKLGHVSSTAFEVEFIEDNSVAAPTVTYNWYNGDNQVTDTSFIYDNGSTVYYNSNQINKIVFTPSVTSDASGIVGYATTNTSTTVWTTNPIEVSNPTGVITIYAKDNVGNVSSWSKTFTGDGIAPAPNNTYLSGNRIYNYISKDDGVVGDVISIGTDHEKWDNAKTNYVNSDFKIKFTATESGSGIKGYKFVSHSSDSDAPDTPSEFTDYTSTDISLSYSDLVDPGFHNYEWLFLKDNVGNISSYVISNPGNSTYTWLRKYQAINSGTYNVGTPGNWTNSNGDVISTVSVTISGLTTTYAVKSIEFDDISGTYDLGEGENHVYVTMSLKDCIVTVNGKTVSGTLSGNVLTITDPYIVNGGTMSITVSVKAVDSSTNSAPVNYTATVNLPDVKVKTITDNFGTTYNPGVAINQAIARIAIFDDANFSMPVIQKSVQKQSEVYVAQNSIVSSISSIVSNVPAKTKAKKSKKVAAKSSETSVKESSAELFTQMPALESVDVLGALAKGAPTDVDVEFGSDVGIKKPVAAESNDVVATAAAPVLSSQSKVMESSESESNMIVIVLIIAGALIAAGVGVVLLLKKKSRIPYSKEIL